jgi:hypothetical protein
MRNNRVIIVTTIFLVSVFLGFLGGAYIIQYGQTARRLHPPVASRTQAVSVAPTHTVPVKTSNGQHNLLLITVDNLISNTPQVEGIWLVIDLQNNSHLSLLPVYPAINLDGTLSKTSLAGHFSLDSKKAPSTDFLNNIASLDLSWDSYIVLDHMGLAELGDPVGKAELTGEATDAEREVSVIPSPYDDPQAALRSQVALFETACKELSSLSRFEKAGEIVNRLSRHLVSNLPTARIVSGLENLLSVNGSLFCEFPVLPQPETIQN